MAAPLLSSWPLLSPSSLFSSLYNSVNISVRRKAPGSHWTAWGPGCCESEPLWVCGWGVTVHVDGVHVLMGLGSLVGCRLWGHTESDTTERLHVHFSLSWFMVFLPVLSGIVTTFNFSFSFCILTRALKTAYLFIEIGLPTWC